MGRSLLFSAVVCLAVGSAVRAGDWTGFRGPDGTGVSSEKNVPLTWGPEKNIKWKVPFGPGNSSPIVAGTRVFITLAADKGQRRSLHCFDRDTGKELWVKTIEYTGDDPTHNTSPWCSSTPAVDGKRVVVFEGSAGVHCYDYDGNPLWSRDLGTFRHIWGYATSPVFYKGKIILNCGPAEKVFVTALDAETGRTLWQTDEPQTSEWFKGRDGFYGSWSTPQISKVGGQDQILVSLPHYVNAYDPNDGRILWKVEGLGDLVYTSVAPGDGIAVAMSGFNGPAIAFKTGGSGNVTETNRFWQQKGGNPQRIATGIIIGRDLFMVNEPGTVQCLDVESGKDRWKDRLPGGNVWGSPVLAEDRFYVTNQKGTTIVFAVNTDKFELLAENELDEHSNSTPALSNGQIFLRTYKHLYCIEEMK